MARINLKEFKQSVLSDAMQGKLTEQNPDKDGTGQELLDKIQDKKQELIKKSKIKKHKALPSVSKDKVPFKIPDNWVWTRLGNISDIRTGFSFKKQLYKSSGIRIIRISDFNNNGFLNNDPKYINDNSKYNKFVLKSGDSLMAMTGGSVGKLSPVLNLNTKLFLNQRVADFRTIGISKFYLNYYLRCNYIVKEVSNNKNSTNDNISMTFLKNLIIPIPPLAEQKRIVSKVHICFKFADAIQKERILNHNFSRNMKHTLLQMAVEGKLTKQLKSDGTADELLDKIKNKKQELIKAGKIRRHKPLPKVDKSKVPFNIPNNWKWVRADVVGSWKSGSTPRRSNPKNYNGNIPWLKTGDLNDSYINKTSEHISNQALKNNSSLRLNPKGSILIAMYGVGTIGKLGILNINATTNQACCACIPYINNIFIYYYLLLMRPYIISMQEGVGSHKNISRTKVIHYPFPLPPLPEQHRIVQTLHRLFSKLQF